MTSEKSQLMIDTERYKGPDRRKESSIALCGYHFEHAQILKTHNVKINDLETNHREDIKDVENKVSTRSKELFGEMKTKASNKLLYMFIIGYTAFFVVGIATVYKGMHDFDKNISEKISVVREEVSKSNVHLLYQRGLTTDLKNGMKDINKKIDDHISQTKNGVHK